MSETIETTGTVWGIFAHRIALDTAAGKVLADLGPKGAETVTIAEGDRITVQGIRKPSEIKAASVVTRDGVTHAIAWPEKDGKGGKHDKGADDHGDPAVATAAAEADGYVVTGAPSRKPKHWDVPATRDGASFVLHVELDGNIKKAKPQGTAAH